MSKFDGTGYDKDLVEALERDIISQNPNVKWYIDELLLKTVIVYGVTVYTTGPVVGCIFFLM